MKLIEHPGEDKLQFISNPITPLIIGMIILIPDIIMIFMGIDTKNEINIMIGAGLFCIAIVIMLIRIGIDITPGSGDVIVWKGVLNIPILQKTYRLSDFNKIWLTKMVHKTKNGQYYTYATYLSGREGLKLLLHDVRDELEARRYSEKCSKLLKLDHHDDTEGRSIIRKFDELDLSIREKAERDGKIPSINEVGEPPQSLKQYIISRTGKSIELYFPPTAIEKFIKPLILIIISMFFFLPVACLIFLHKHLSSGNIISFVGFTGLQTLIMFIFIIVVIKRKLFFSLGDVNLLRISPGMLTVKIGNKTFDLNASEIEELFLNMPFESSMTEIPQIAKHLIKQHMRHGIIVKSDIAILRFGARFSQEELVWIYKIMYALLAGKK